MGRNCLYKIEGFIPPEKGREMGGYGFSVYLDRKFARDARQRIIPSEMQERLQETGRGVIKRLFTNKLNKSISYPYYFEEDSLLIRYIKVPGDACDISVDSTELEDLLTENIKDRNINKIPLKYSPHNVDNVIETYALFSLFTLWTGCAEAILSDSHS